VKLELFSATNSSVKTYNTTLELNSGTGYVVNANFTNLTNVTIKTVTVSGENIAPTQTTTTTTTSTVATTATTTATQTAVQPSAQTATKATSASGDSAASSGDRPDASVDCQRERPDPANRRVANSHLGPRRHRYFPPSISPKQVSAELKAVATAPTALEEGTETAWRPTALPLSSAAVDW